MRIAAIALSLVILLGSSGCSSQAPEEPSGARVSKGAPRLSDVEVLALADKYAKAEREKYEPFDLKFYQDRHAEFDSKARTWFIYYDRKPNRWPGDHFSIHVDDVTRELRYFGGL